MSGVFLALCEPRTTQGGYHTVVYILRMSYYIFVISHSSIQPRLEAGQLQ